MDGETRTRWPVLAIVAAGALVVGLLVFGVMALVGGDDDLVPPESGPKPTSALATATTRSPSAAPTSVTTSEVSPTTGAIAEPGPDATSGLPGYDSEACALFRELLEMIDDPALRAGAAQVGCI